MEPLADAGEDHVRRESLRLGDVSIDGFELVGPHG